MDIKKCPSVAFFCMSIYAPTRTTNNRSWSWGIWSLKSTWTELTASITVNFCDLWQFAFKPWCSKVYALWQSCDNDLWQLTFVTINFCDNYLNYVMTLRVCTDMMGGYVLTALGLTIQGKGDFPVACITSLKTYTGQWIALRCSL